MAIKAGCVNLITPQGTRPSWSSWCPDPDNPPGSTKPANVSTRACQCIFSQSINMYSHNYSNWPMDGVHLIIHVFIDLAWHHNKTVTGPPISPWSWQLSRLLTRMFELNLPGNPFSHNPPLFVGLTDPNKKFRAKSTQMLSLDWMGFISGYQPRRYGLVGACYTY